METPNDDYDNPWKIAIERYFREFLAIFCPWAEAMIDWDVEPEFHDQELRQVTRDAKAGLRRLDKLAKVRLLDGRDLHIHLEVQLCRQRNFGLRMFNYNVRLFDRYGQEVSSIAVLADRNPHWRPTGFQCVAPGTLLRFDFTAIKLLDFDPSPAGFEDNFFAFIVQAHFATMRTRHNPDGRLASKISLVRAVYEGRWSKQRILDFNDVLDWLMQLPEPLKRCYEAALSELERRLKMPYVNSMVREAVERGEAQGMQQGMQQGMEQGLRQGLQQGMKRGLEKGMELGVEQGLKMGLLEGQRKLLRELLQSRFGLLPGKAMTQIECASERELSQWACCAVRAGSLGEVLG